MKEIIVKEKEYKLNLRLKDVVELEKELGTNPINMFMDAATMDASNVTKIPFKFGDIALIIKYSLRQFHHGMKDEAVYALIDDYMEENENAFQKLTELVMELMKRFF